MVKHGQGDQYGVMGYDPLKLVINRLASTFIHRVSGFVEEFVNLPLSGMVGTIQPRIQVQEMPFSPARPKGGLLDHPNGPHFRCLGTRCSCPFEMPSWHFRSRASSTVI